MAPTAGGVYRTEIQDFGFTDGFDPVGETSPLAVGLYSQLLLRTLVTYPHVAGVAGTKVVPDLATDTGWVSTDGLTWTFTLKDAPQWGPPVSRSITSADVANAFRRLDTAALQPLFVPSAGVWYDGLIAGMDGPLQQAPVRISGIETPNDRTIVFHLNHPAGDFPDRLALPAAAPVPMEVAGCYRRAGGYGRTLIASGPYMLPGEALLDTSTCRGVLRSDPEFDPAHHLRLVRNPNYEPSTDSPQDRSSYLDGVDIQIEPNSARILHDVATGWIDGLVSDPSTLGDASNLRSPSLRVRSYASSGSLHYLFMNLLVPPFDDVHVRRAVELAVDQRRLLAGTGGRVRGLPADHLFRSPVLSTDGGYDPYPPDLAAARAEMARSRYDHDRDGICDDPVCRNVLFLPCFTPPNVFLIPGITAAFESVGVALKARELDGGPGCVASQTPLNLVTVGFAEWRPEFPDPVGLAERLASAGISCELQTNVSEVGMTREQMRRCGLPPMFSGGPRQHAPLVPLPPSVDADVARCESLANDARNACWDAFDHHVMEDIVPWVTLYWTNDSTVVTGPTVEPATVTLDQFSGLISLCRLAVLNHAATPS